MNPWIIILVIGAALVFLLDFLIRRKKWNANTKVEKISLVLHMVASPTYVFLSILGIMWQLVAGGANSAFGQIICDVTLFLCTYFWVLAIAAIIVPFVLRKKGKAKTGIWVNVITLVFIVIVMCLNSLADSFL